MSKKVVYISPANHGLGQNKDVIGDCYEDKHCIAIGEALKAALKEYDGVAVYTGTTAMSMAQRCNRSDEVGADLYIVIHTNATSNKNTHYLLFMAYETSGKYKKLYDVLERHFKSVYDGLIRFEKRRDLYEINTPKAMTMYCEMGFHTNKDDLNNFIHKPEKVGDTIAAAIAEYLCLNKKQKATGGLTVSIELNELKEGSTGAQVKTIQRIFHCMYSSTIKIDGDFGPVTDKYVRKFQSSKDLKIDGVVGSKTWTKLLK